MAPSGVEMTRSNEVVGTGLFEVTVLSAKGRVVAVLVLHKQDLFYEVCALELRLEVILVEQQRLVKEILVVL